MISQQGQMEFFRLISENLKKNVTCYAFGGNAMMFYGYKSETKDVDLLFIDEENREEFIRVIQLLGYKESSPFKIYIEEKLREKHRPLMFKREDDNGRFDLFVKKIFKTLLSPKMKENAYAEHEFNGEYKLIVKVLRKEQLVILKSVTDRQNDFDDIKTILKQDKYFDWQYLIDEVLWQHQHGDTWILLDMEEMFKELKKYIHVPEKFVKQLHEIKQEH
jgi:hypothetical protein